MRVMVERTLAIIKPDAVRRHVVGAIIQRYEQTGLIPVAVKMVRLTKPQAEAFYYVHKQRPFFDSLCSFMSSGPIVVLALEGESAIQRLRDLMGATDPAKAAEGTIRKAYGTHIEHNAVHGSDSAESAQFELGYFFSALESPQR
jgi:nucleoside-diphosphate kinase